MSTPKVYTKLCGSDLPPWALSFEQVPMSRFIRDYSLTLGQASWPVLLYEQCPQEWLDNDPGFFVLMRDVKDTHSSRPWIIGSQDYELRVRSRNLRPQNILCILHHDPQLVEQKYSTLLSRFPGARILWTQYACSQAPHLPLENYIDFNVLMFQKKFEPDCVADFNFYVGDTFSPAHIFCFHQGASLLNEKSRESSNRKVLTKKSSWYGDWVIYEPGPSTTK